MRVRANLGGGQRVKFGHFTPNTSTFTEIDCGFKPTYVVTWFQYQNNPIIRELDTVTGTILTSFTNNWRTDQTSIMSPYLQVTDTGFKLKATASGTAVDTYYVAFSE